MKKYKLQVGDKVKREATVPIAEVVYNPQPEYGAPYIWIGNDAPGNAFCFGTLASVARLRALARAINAACDHYETKTKRQKASRKK